MGNARIWDKYKDDVRVQRRKLDQAKKKSLLDQVEQGRGEGVRTAAENGHGEMMKSSFCLK